MKITHYGHACVLAEPHHHGRSARLLFDPGVYSAGFEDLTGLDAVLITHEHPDHLDLNRLPKLMRANPRARLITDPGTAPHLAKAGLDCETVATGDVTHTAGLTVHTVSSRHATVHPDLPCPRNNGYLIEDLLYHPGDAFIPPPSTPRLLLLPTGGPWMKVGESIDYLRLVRPEVAVPIHQEGLADAHRQLHYQLFRDLSPSATTITIPSPGTTVTLW